MKQRFFSLVAAAALGLAATLPAQASTLPSADFKPGQTIGLGYAGMAYDYAFQRATLGVSLSSFNVTSPNFSRLMLATRGMVRFLDTPALSAAVIGGVAFDPGMPGGRSFMVPDIGVGAAYSFRIWELPLSLRFNYTLTLDQGQNTNVNYGGVIMDPSQLQPRGNFLQRLSAGPSTMIALAYQPSDNLEVVLGGGTLFGVRFSY